MKGYKASNNGKCRDLAYEVGKTYTFNGEIKACFTGFHYCKKIDDVLEYYDYDRNTTVIFEIEDLGESVNEGNKTVTNKMKIVRIVDPSEYNLLFTRYQFDSNNNIIKYENSDGYWWKKEYDSNNNIIKLENSDGYWEKKEYDSNNNLIKVENSNGDWKKMEYDPNNNVIAKETETTKWTITIE